MNGVNNSNDDVVECPLCMEPLEVDDLNFYPCTCGYQICRFCWHRIRTDENELCPACRKEYPENPADFTPLTQEEMIAFKSQKRQRDQQRKQKITENRKHLSNVRVVQKNLVFVVGLPPRLADADILKKHEYFGKYGKIHKVVINPSTTYAGVQGPSASAYVTYVNNSDALRAIQSVNNVMIDGRLIKTSLGTTKYCSHFMKNQPCPKLDCMYLHELGDPEASFTKEEMHQGKHQEYEKRLHDALIANSGASPACAMGQVSSNNGSMVSIGNGGSVNIANSKSGDSKAQNGIVLASSSSGSSAPSSAMSSSSSSSSSASGGTAQASGVAGSTQQKEAWPSLSVSPVNTKEVLNGSNSSGKNKKEKVKQEKARSEKNNKAKIIKNSNHNQNNNSSSGSSNNCNVTNKENNPHNNDTKEISTLPPSLVESTSEQNNSGNNVNNKSKSERIKEKSLLNRNNKDQQKEKRAISADEEVKLIEDSEMVRSGNSNNKVANIINIELDNGNPDENAAKNEDQRSLSSSSNLSSSRSSNSSSVTNSDALSISESASGKSSPGSFPECNLTSDKLTFNSEKQSAIALDISKSNGSDHSNQQQPITAAVISNSIINGEMMAALENIGDNKNERINSEHTDSDSQLPNSNAGNLVDTSAALSKLNLFDDSNSFFSSAASFQQSLLLRNKHGSEVRQNPMNSVVPSHLPDLLNGIDGYQKNTNSNEWGEAFKNAMLRHSKQIDELQQHQQMQHHQLFHQQHLQQQEEFLRIQELQKRNNLLNNIGFSQINAPHNDIANSFQGNADISRLSQAALLQQQQLLQQQAAHSTDHLLNNSLFGTSMSKFFDFHKNQQQQLHQQQFLINGHASGTANNPLSDHLRMASLLENNRFNSQFLDQSNGLLNPQQQQLQKQRLLNKFDPMLTQQQPQQQQAQSQNQQQQQQQTHLNRIANQFSQNVSVDDDLGFDPFIETQKGLAELMENEVVQQQNTSSSSNTSNTTPVAPKSLQQQQHQHQQQQQLMDNMQRARMPPPGFNHMNAFGFGVPRAQSNTSKVLPFMNIEGNGAAANGQSTQQLQMPNSWNPHLATFQQQQQSLGDSQMHQMNQNGGPPNGGNHKSFSNNDWTAMDPAILSFRQFSSFPQQQQIPPHPQPQDMFIQHLTHQHQQNNQAGFGSQPQLQGGVNLSNGLLNSQHSSQPQVNFSHTNWLNSEQSLFMNSLANGFTNNFDKFSTSMPPGMHQSNLNMNKQQQKTECIN